MLGIQELDDIICGHLGRHELAQCARVCKKWHSVVAPRIWSDLSWLGWYGTPRRWRAFRSMVLEDYLAGQCHHGLHKQGFHTERAQPPALSNCGQWIQMLPSIKELLEVLQPHTLWNQSVQPTAHELLFHLFKRCSSEMKVQLIQYDYADYDSDEMKLILSATLPRARSLHIQAFLEGTWSESVKLGGMLDQLSHTLENLRIDFEILGADEVHDMVGNGVESQASFKELVLNYRSDILDAVGFCSWLWKHCSHVQKLEIDGIDRSAQSLAQTMWVYMPDLCEITLCGKDVPEGGIMIEADATAAILSGSRSGWKVVTVMSNARLGRTAMEIMKRHHPTLEKLDIHGNPGLLRSDLVQLLRDCINLHTFAYIDTPSRWVSDKSYVCTNMFVDLDPDTGTLRPWKCEKSLKVLQVTLEDITRLGFEEEAALANREREVEGLLYDRLARLTNLEVLRLRGYSSRGGRLGYLRMSLDSGLRRLSELTNLRELDVSGMDTRMSVQEVQWMVIHWPRLRSIRGFAYGSLNTIAKWLQEHYPEVQAS
ncbi:MAG: hypothetical protein J3Q66DRAFT_350794 [Benniella sp.]|nr:MAG: hypothetical protein J3Q66DRAFT_350794 [Benniella sp.]